MIAKKQFYIIFLMALMAVKVSAVPIYFDDCHEEEEHIDDCALCDYAIYTQNTAFSSPPEIPRLEINTAYFSYEPKIHLGRRDYKCYRSERYFGRPPPIL